MKVQGSAPGDGPLRNFRSETEAGLRTTGPGVDKHAAPTVAMSLKRLAPHTFRLILRCPTLTPAPLPLGRGVPECAVRGYWNAAAGLRPLPLSPHLRRALLLRRAGALLRLGRRLSLVDLAGEALLKQGHHGGFLGPEIGQVLAQFLLHLVPDLQQQRAVEVAGEDLRVHVAFAAD